MNVWKLNVNSMNGRPIIAHLPTDPSASVIFLGIKFFNK